MKTKRKWGYYITLLRTPWLVLKILVLAPGKRVSIQEHLHRSELWIYWRGVTYIPKQMVHTTFINKRTHCIFEIQWGKCSEEDIIRYD